jgi:type IV pilus assembly protein PilC
MNAYREEDVRRELIQQGYIPVRIKELRTTASGGFNLNMNVGKTGLKLKATEVAAFTRGLHQLIKAGISVPMSVEALGKDTDNAALTEVCQDISARIINGSPISEAFAQHPRTFDEVFCGYLESGERTGTLINATGRLAILTEKRAQLRTKVKAVSTYPILVSIVIGLILSAIITILVPQYANIYAEFNAQLPAPTLLLVKLSHHFLPLTLLKPYEIPIPNITSPIFWLLVIIFGLRFFLKKTANNPEVGMRVDKIRFHLPLAGKLIHYTALYSWVTTLAGALETGVRTTAAVNMASRVSGSRWIKTISPSIEELLQSGVPLSKLLGDYPEIFPANLRTMVATGETSGELTSMLDSAATAISEEIDALVSGLSAKVEVALIMVLGICVGAMLIALYLPIIKLDATVANTASTASTTTTTTLLVN